MPMEESKHLIPHNLIMQNREKLSVSGVEDVENFDDREIVLYTSRGKLTIRGRELHIGRLSLDDGDLSIEGIVDTLEYTEGMSGRGGFFSRLFG